MSKTKPKKKNFLGELATFKNGKKELQKSFTECLVTAIALCISHTVN